MNILLFASTDFPNGTASTAICSLMVKGIRENGLPAYLLIPFGSDKAKGLNNTKTKGHTRDVPFVFMSGKTDLPKTFRILSMLKGMLQSALLIYGRYKKNKNDMVILYSPDFVKYFPIIFVCFILKIPMFSWQVERTSSSKEFKGIKGNINYLSAIITEKVLPKVSKGMIVISSHLKNYYRKNITGEKIFCSPILVNPIEFNYLEEDNIYKFKKKYKGKRLIVYSGTFGEQDGFPYILKAFKKFIELFPDSLLLVTGKPNKFSPIDSIYHMVDELNLKNNFHYLGLVSRKELLIINKAADLLLVCRSNSVYANHGFPWKLGEYCMTKKPIVATKVGDIEKYFKEKENIFLANPEDPNSIFLQMKNVFDDYNKALEIAKDGYEQACKVFNYLTNTKKIIDFVKS